MKKLVSLLLVMLMAMALCVPTMATGTGTSDDGNGTVTITNAKEGEVYAMYKVLDVTYSKNGETENFAYTINENFKEFFATTAEGTKTYMTDAQAYEYVKSQSDVAKFATALANFVKTNNVAGTNILYDADGTKGEMPYGYYLMIPTMKDGENAGSALFSLDTVTPTVEIQNKSEYPTITKTANDDSVEIGQVVTYTITGTLPSPEGYDSYTYEITDTMSTGLTFNKDMVLTVGGIEWKYDAASTSPIEVGGVKMYKEVTDTGFTIAINPLYSSFTGKNFKLTYTATVNEDAKVVSVGNEGMANKAELKYSNDPTDATSFDKTPSEIVEVFTSSIIIDKYDGNEIKTLEKLTEDLKEEDPDVTDAEITIAYEAQFNEAKRLADAKFVLKNSAGKFYKYADAKVSWVDAQADATEVTTNASGYAEFEGLEEGTYYLVETQAPEGYNLLTEAIEVKVEATRQNDAIVSQTDKPVGVANNSGMELPSTGGIGTTIFYAVGGALMAGAAILLITKKKMSRED